MHTPGLPTFRDCLERETSSEKRKYPPVGVQACLAPIIGPWWGPGAKPLTGVRGPRQRPLMLRNFEFADLKMHNFRHFFSLN